MRNPATTAYLEHLTRHESMPQPLGEWVRTELDAGLGYTLHRLALAAALEGCCGIPLVHRASKRADDAGAALLLAREALASLWHWWAPDKRAALLVEAEAAASEGQTARVLSCWCSWRTTERAKRLHQEPFIHFATETLAA